MYAFNYFSFTGIVYKDSKTSLTSKGKPITSFILAVQDQFKNGNTNYIPFVALNEMSKKCELLANNGNLVTVIGSVTTKEIFNNVTGKIDVSLNFVVEDIFPLYRKRKTNLKKLEQDFSTLIKTYQIN